MNKKEIINGAVMAICLGVMGWVGHKAADNAEQLAGLKVSVDGVKESTLRLERKVDELVPRREFEARLMIAEAEQRKIDVRLREVDLEILKLKGKF